jgi:hypothetical protein
MIMKVGKKKKKLGFRRVSFLVSDEEYKLMEKYYARMGGEKDINKWAGIMFCFIVNDLEDTAKRQQAEHGVEFAEPGQCSCPDCLGKGN